MLVIHDTAIHRIGYDFYADIAERIVEGRKTLGLTQIQFAKKSQDAGIEAGAV